MTDTGAANPTLHGDGKTGKRLWVRTPDGRWAIPPYGAGVDNTLRSLNIWEASKKRWLTPSWPYVSNSYSSLNVKVPQGLIWDNRSGENPNSDLFNHDGYIKLFYMAERTNENWRIVNLLNSVPVENPNVGVKHFRDFGPRGASYNEGSTSYYNNSAPPNSGVNPVVTVYTSADPGNQNDLLSDSFLIRQLPPSQAVFSALQGLTTRTAGMLDLAAIRLHLQTEFPQSNFFIGQYADIATMVTKRVFIAGQLVYTLSHFAENDTYLPGVPEVASMFDNAEYSFYYNTNVAGISAGSSWPYQPRYPAQRTVSGTRFVHRKGIPGPTSTLSNSVDAPQRTRFGGGYVQLNIIEPGEDNIAFTCVASEPVGLGSTSAAHYTNPAHTQTASGPYPWGVYSSCYFVPSFMQIHYAVPGHDTPADTHEPDMNIG